jgi:membrane-anchored protein YejM (alkaline phosphatase superfamily)
MKEPHLINFSQQKEQSVLFITLDSCRYDTFVSTPVPNLKAVGKLYRAMAPGNFTYGSHAAMFVGFTPGVANKFEPYVNSKYGKIFRILSGGLPGKAEHFVLTGRNIIDGFKRLGYLTIGSGAVGWFDPNTETGQSLIQDFDAFFYPSNTFSLARQIQWISEYLNNLSQPVFVFLNVGETHVPYYYEGASWSIEDNPCIPFSSNNRRDECIKRQKMCLQYVDQLLQPLLNAFQNSNILVCADHGDCWGEDGLWEHGFYHEKVLEVPLIFKLGSSINS